MRMKHLAAAALTIVLSVSCSERQQDYPFRNPDLPVDERIDDLLKRLTAEEKVGQMMNSTPAIERLGIPKYDWWNEALHGVARAGRATVFPQAIAMAATFDDEALHETFTMVSDEARAKYHHKANGLLVFLQEELLKIGYFVRYFCKCPIFVTLNNKKKER